MLIDVLAQPVMASISPANQVVGQVYQIRTASITSDLYAVLRLEDQVLLLPTLELAALDDPRLVGQPFLHRPYAKLIIG